MKDDKPDHTLDVGTYSGINRSTSGNEFWANRRKLAPEEDPLVKAVRDIRIAEGLEKEPEPNVVLDVAQSFDALRKAMEDIYKQSKSSLADNIMISSPQAKSCYDDLVKKP